MNIFRLLKKMLQNAPHCTIQNFFRGSMPPNPLANAKRRKLAPNKFAPLGKS